MNVKSDANYLKEGGRVTTEALTADRWIDEFIRNPVEECLDVMPPGATSGSW